MFLFRDIYYFLVAAAAIPAIALLIKVYRADKAEPEPPELLFSLVALGVIVTPVAAALEQLGTAVLNTYVGQSSRYYNVYMYFIVVAISEEGLKYLALRLRTWRHPAFNYLFDGVVYSVFVSLGFALWENIRYVMSYGFGTALIRAITAVPGHACFGVFMGVWYGLAKKYENYGYPGRSRFCRLLALLLPVLTHGCYDFVASMDSPHGIWIFIGFIAVMFVIAFQLVRRISRHDEYIG